MMLTTVLTGLIGKPYEYGKTDCASLARAAVVAMTGRDPVNVLWRDRKSAAKAWKRTGGVCAVLKRIADEVPVVCARAGDIITVGHNAMVVIGNRLIATSIKRGVFQVDFRPLDLRGRAQCWRVRHA